MAAGFVLSPLKILSIYSRGISTNKYDRKLELNYEEKWLMSFKF